jgi:hypothetical protein
MVVSGKVRFFVEGRGTNSRALAMCCTFRRTLFMGATMMDEEVVLIDIFTPIREDFLSSK